MRRIATISERDRQALFHNTAAKMGLPEPVFQDKRGLFRVIFYNSSGQNTRIKPLTLEEYCRVPRTRKEVANFLGVTQAYAIQRYIVPLINKGVLVYTIPDKPKSHDQRIVIADSQAQK